MCLGYFQGTVRIKYREKNMDYIIDVVIPILKHHVCDQYITEKILKKAVWYGISTQSYIQRTDLFDGTWLCSSTSDDYIMLLLQDVFNANEINVYDKVADCNSSVRMLRENSIKDNCIYIAKDKTSLFTSFGEKIRNAMAHGSINRYDEYFYLLNQYKPKPDAGVSFLLQTQYDINTKMTELWDAFKMATEQENAFKYRCLNRILQLKKVGKYCYSELYKCYVIVDDDFRYTTKSRVDDINALIIKYNSINASAVVIISENLGSISAKNLTSKDGKVRVIAQSKIIEYFNVPGVNQI